MEVHLIKMKNQELFKVRRQVFKSGNTFNHLKNKIFGLKPVKTSVNMHHGRPMGKKITFIVKGTLPQYGYTLGDILEQQIKTKLYANL
jgi:hypothetical protein